MRTLFTGNRTARFQNFVAPPNPQARIFLTLLLLLLSWQSANAQLLNYDTYSISMKAYLNQQWTAERSEWTAAVRGQRWSYIPNVGLAFGLPTVGLNTGQIAAYKQQQGTNAAKLRAIDAKYQLLLNDQLNLLKIEVEKAGVEQAKLLTYSATLEARKSIFEIYQEAFKKKELKPLDFLQQKLAYESAVQQYLLAVKSYQIVVLEVERLAHYNMPNELISYTTEDVEGASSFLEVLPSKLPKGLLTKPSSTSKPVSNPLGN
jgi:hypothetical protein